MEVSASTAVFPSGDVNTSGSPCLVLVKQEPEVHLEMLQRQLSAEALLSSDNHNHEQQSQGASASALASTIGALAQTLPLAEQLDSFVASELSRNSDKGSPPTLQPVLLSPPAETFRPQVVSRRNLKPPREPSTKSRWPRLEQDVNCSVCSATFSYLQSLDMHVRKMHPSVKVEHYSCHVCSATFNAVGNLRLHISRLHDKAAKFTCEHCGKQMFNSYEARIHQRIHTKEKPLKCEFCAECFSRKDVLKRHCLRSHGRSLFTERAIGAPFSCSRCMRTFALKAPLTDHLMNFHLSIRGFRCTICKRTYTTATHLNRHIGCVHQHKTVYRCASCGFQARGKEGLQNHVTKHSGFDRSHPELFPHACTLCNVGFTDLGRLKVHAKSHHVAGRKWKCKRCPAVFGHSGTLV